MDPNNGKIVESIIGHRTVRGKDKYRVKWKDHPENESTWVSIDKLHNDMDKVDEYISKRNKKEIDHIIGCGQRNGMKYFLVRFKGATENEIVDWDSAEEFAVQVMEFFGSRLKWTSLDNIVDDTEDDLNDQQQNNDNMPNPPGTSSLLDNPINDIEFAQ